MDIMNLVYETLIADPFIYEQAGKEDRIKSYEYPKSADVDNPFIVIDPIDVPTPSDFADDTWIKFDCLIQIDVWTRDRKKSIAIANKIRDVMWNEFGFNQNSGPQEFDNVVFRDARRYRGKLYREDFDSL
ncbi:MULTISPECIES: DUF3168 domain-containing protein [Bacteria]|uniref:DUF3168 domain-containing protein n=1 Tax=Oceanobacillus kimchii TaxID=746691 RepID=A0ABQ5TDG0_9BACI|nr:MULTISPECIES: DUF3168 domain-containing protein [Bacteria]GLO64749.1 hypothetical protein MACH08_05330 [Oceanobacillus kimchii]